MNCLPASARRSLPQRSGIYALFAGKDCIYVGSSLRIKARIAAHPYRDKAEIIGYWELPASYLLSEERKAIEWLKPALNKVPARRPYCSLKGHDCGC